MSYHTQLRPPLSGFTVNRIIGKGREALTPAATFWINSLGVWAVDLAALYLAVMFSPAAGLVAGYLAVVNAVPHLMTSLVRREYNPGVVTAILFFLPVGGWCILEAGTGAGWLPHIAALLAALGVHLAIVIHVARRLARLSPATEHNGSLQPSLSAH